MHSIPLSLENGQKPYSLIGDELHKKVEPSHQLKRPPAWAIDIGVLEKAREMGAQMAVFTDADGIQWRACLDLFYSKGFKLNRGFGRQRALPLQHWMRRGKNIPEQLELL